MALVDTISIQRARKLALNGIIVTSFWSVLSLINMSIFGKNVSLMILPLMSIFFSSLWLNFSLAIAVLAFILVLIGFFLLDRKVSLEVLLSLCFTAVLFFPVVYVVVLQLSKLSSDSAGIGYAL